MAGSEGGHAEKDQPKLAPRRAADPTQTLRRELLDEVAVWPDVHTAQVAVDEFVKQYNTNRPHQSLDMALPVDRFILAVADDGLPLRLPATLSESTLEAGRGPAPTAAGAVVPAPPMLSTNGVDPVDLAVELTRVVPPSGIVTVCGQQFWLGTDRAGTAVTLWADTTVVHLIINGARLKTIPSRLSVAHLQRLLDGDGRPAGPPPIPAGLPGDAVEVDRLVNGVGLISLAGRQYPIGYHFAGMRVTVRLDRGVLQIVDDGVLLRSLPNPLTPSELARIRDARPAGPPPQPAAQQVRVERRIDSRGALVVAGQRIHVGMVHAGRTVTVESADHTFRIYHEDELLSEVARTTAKSVARFKVRKPEGPRRAAR